MLPDQPGDALHVLLVPFFQSGLSLQQLEALLPLPLEVKQTVQGVLLLLGDGGQTLGDIHHRHPTIILA